MLEIGGRTISQWIGISLDEIHRAKPSGVRYITNRFPLLEQEMSRGACIEWLKNHGHGVPPKSACRWCPYMSDRRWREMRATEPDEFALAVAFDAKLREGRKDRINGVKITGELFLHRSMRPLGEVDLANDIDRGQLELFGCTEGMCGV